MIGRLLDRIALALHDLGSARRHHYRLETDPSDGLAVRYRCGSPPRVSITVTSADDRNTLALVLSPEFASLTMQGLREALIEIGLVVMPQGERSPYPLVSGTTDDKTWTITLSRYHRDNLVALFNAIGYPWSNRHADPAMAEWNTGDWVGEIPMMLARTDGSMLVDEKDSPNKRWHR